MLSYIKYTQRRPSLSLWISGRDGLSLISYFNELDKSYTALYMNLRKDEASYL